MEALRGKKLKWLWIVLISLVTLSLIISSFLPFLFI
jgi:flagellar basal body-associated protein FliL